MYLLHFARICNIIIKGVDISHATAGKWDLVYMANLANNTLVSFLSPFLAQRTGIMLNRFVAQMNHAEIKTVLFPCLPLAECCEAKKVAEMQS